VKAAPTRTPATARGPQPGPARARTLAWTVLALAAVAFPFAMQAIEQEFYISVASRMLIYGLAAVSLNLVLGFGGLVSFGHAAFVGIGAYTVGILITEGVPNGWLGFALAMAIAGAFAAVIGAISLRTRGVYFIMITLAFAQMVFYLVNSVKAYGGDEGLNITQRSQFGLAPGLALDLKNDLTFYLFTLALLAACLVLIHRLMHARFGRVILAIRDDEVRAEAVGFAVFRYKLILFTLAGALGGLAGALMVNQQNYVSPNLLHWTQSGLLMVMVILGGVGTLAGGLWGAIVLLTLEDVIAEHTIHWPFYVGWVLLAVVLFAPKGLAGLRWPWRRGGP
jgi:branched-chain amino acid transport system permease protein